MPCTSNLARPASNRITDSYSCSTLPPLHAAGNFTAELILFLSLHRVYASLAAISQRFLRKHRLCSRFQTGVFKSPSASGIPNFRVNSLTSHVVLLRNTSDCHRWDRHDLEKLGGTQANLALFLGADADAKIVKADKGKKCRAGNGFPARHFAVKILSLSGVFSGRITPYAYLLIVATATGVLLPLM